MKTTTLHNLITTASLVAGALLAAVRPAAAMPVSGQYWEDARCDTIPNQKLTDELGNAAVFPINEGIIYSVQQATFTVCVPDDNLPNDWIVRMLNVSGQAWTDLFFSCDLGATVGNADGHIEDTVGAPGIQVDAFRIDGTVTVTGMNDNLLSESINPNEIFEPGEIWEFNVSNFSPIMPGGFVPPIFTTPGVFSGSSPMIATNPGNASILANPVPEPASAGLIGLSLLPLLRRRRRS